MSMLDDNLDINESDLLVKICVEYFKKYGYWKFDDDGVSYAPIYSCDIDSFYLHLKFNEIMETPERYGLCALPDHHRKLIELMVVPLVGLGNQYIKSRLCRAQRPVGVDDTVTIKDILECYGSVG